MSGEVHYLDDYRKFDIGTPTRCWRCGKSKGVCKFYGEGGFVWACRDCPHPSEVSE